MNVTPKGQQVAPPRWGGARSEWCGVTCLPLMVLMKHQVWPPRWVPGAGCRPRRRPVIGLDRTYPSDLASCYWCRAYPRGSEDHPQRPHATNSPPQINFQPSPSLLSVHLLSLHAGVSRHETQRRSLSFCLLRVFFSSVPGDCVLFAPFVQGY